MTIWGIEPQTSCSAVQRPYQLGHELLPFIDKYVSLRTFPELSDGQQSFLAGSKEEQRERENLQREHRMQEALREIDRVTQLPQLIEAKKVRHAYAVLSLYDTEKIYQYIRTIIVTIEVPNQCLEARIFARHHNNWIILYQNQRHRSNESTVTYYSECRTVRK
jgi:hypothetical protein